MALWEGVGPGGRKWATGVSYRVALSYHMLQHGPKSHGASQPGAEARTSQPLGSPLLSHLVTKVSLTGPPALSHSGGPPPGLGTGWLPPFLLPFLTDTGHASHDVPLRVPSALTLVFPLCLNPFQAGTIIERPWRLASPLARVGLVIWTSGFHWVC